MRAVVAVDEPQFRGCVGVFSDLLSRWAPHVLMRIGGGRMTIEANLARTLPMPARRTIATAFYACPPLAEAVIESDRLSEPRGDVDLRIVAVVILGDHPGRFEPRLDNEARWAGILQVFGVPAG